MEYGQGIGMGWFGHSKMRMSILNNYPKHLIQVLMQMPIQIHSGAHSGPIQPFRAPTQGPHQEVHSRDFQSLSIALSHRCVLAKWHLCSHWYQANVGLEPFVLLWFWFLTWPINNIVCVAKTDPRDRLQSPQQQSLHTQVISLTTANCEPFPIFSLLNQ